MKHIKKIIIMALSIVGVSSSAVAQGVDAGGLMLNRDIITPSDMFELTQPQFSFGTARSMAMAGAFTSLGADLSSMSINPAGLGMYKGNDISITPMMSMQRSMNSANDYKSNKKNKFSIANFGFAANVYEGEGDILSITFGFGYNRIQDLNYNYSFQQTGNVSSIADTYSAMLNSAGVTLNDLQGDNLVWGNMGGDLWPAILGYKTGMTDYVTNNETGQLEWAPTWIGDDQSAGANNTDIGQYASVESIGSIGEYAFSMGMNISNKLYIGATLGLQSVYQKKYYYYGEDYYYANKTSDTHPDHGDAGIPFQLMYSNFDQTSIISGSGVNFKLGLTYRPIANLRIGVAFHTPTYYSLDREYQASMSSNSFSNDPNYDPKPDEFPRPNGDREILLSDSSPLLVDDYEYGWSFTSPTKMLFGASYTFGGIGLISIDYQRDWYNTIRLKDAPIDGLQEESKNTMKSTFKGSNTVRIGAEFRPTQRFALRAGFGYTGSWLQDEDAILASPITKSTTYYSAGIGFILSRSAYLDLAYSYQTSPQTEYNLFYADTAINSSVISSSDYYSTDINRHNVSLTLGFRF